MICLTPIEFKLIHLLVQNPNKIFSRADISQKLAEHCNTKSKLGYSPFKFKKKT